MIHLVIADDHTMFRRSLLLKLRSASGYEVVGEAADGEEAVRMIADSRPTPTVEA